MKKNSHHKSGRPLTRNERGHSLFQGRAGSGIRVDRQQMTRMFMARSDVSQLKALYSGDDGERLAEAIRQNCSVWFLLKPGGTVHGA